MRHPDLDTAATRTLDAQALNGRQHRALYDPSAEIDSVAEKILALRRFDVPDHAIRELLLNVRDILAMNASERHAEHDVQGAVDRVRRTPDLIGILTIKTLARELREDLAVLSGTGGDRITAALRLNDTIRRTPRDRLLSQSLRHELGANRHDLLTTLVGQARP